MKKKIVYLIFFSFMFFPKVFSQENIEFCLLSVNEEYSLSSERFLNYRFKIDGNTRVFSLGDFLLYFELSKTKEDMKKLELEALNLVYTLKKCSKVQVLFVQGQENQSVKLIDNKIIQVKLCIFQEFERNKKKLRLLKKLNCILDIPA